MRMIAANARQARCLFAYCRFSKTDISFAGARCTRDPAMKQEPRERDTPPLMRSSGLLAGLILINADPRSRKGLTPDGYEMLMGRHTMILQPISSVNVLLAGVALLGWGAPQTNVGGFSPANRETSGEVILVVEQTSPAARVHSLQGQSPSSKSLRTKPRTVPGPNSQASTLPRPGTPIFGSRGFTGTVTSSHGRHATVAPTGGGAPGILIPRSRSTGTLFLPGRPPVTVIMHP